MYTFLIDDDNEIIATKKERIMQRSKLVDSFVIYVPKMYKEDIDMSEYSAYIEYLKPISKKYVTEDLTMAESVDKEGYLECKLSFDTDLTTEPGNTEFQVTFIKVDIDPDGNEKQYVRKTSTAELTIVPISAWSDIIPDEALTAVDQRMVQLQSMINELADISGTYDLEKADNIGFNEDGEVQLKSKGTFIGDSIDLAIPDKADDQDGVEDGVINLDDIYSEDNP